MNLIDIASVAVLVLFMLGGIYKGFFSTVLSTGAYIITVLLSLCLVPLGSSIVKNDASLYNMMLYYTEGSEFIANHEYVREEISSLSAADINQIIADAHLPYPMGREIEENIARESFASENITMLGDYFNQTIVNVFINILAFLVAFCIIRAILALVINAADYASGFPVLRSGELALSAATGLVRGMLALFLIFMLVPIVLTALGQFDLITNMVDDSVFASLFYRLNFLLSIVA